VQPGGKGGAEPGHGQRQAQELCTARGDPGLRPRCGLHVFVVLDAVTLTCEQYLAIAQTALQLARDQVTAAAGAAADLGARRSLVPLPPAWSIIGAAPRSSHGATRQPSLHA